MAVVNVDQHNFEHQVSDSRIPVLLVFSTDWCGPCLRLAPILDELAKEYSGRVRVCRVNADNNRELAHQYEVTSVPTLLFLKRDVVGKLLGNPSDEAITAQLSSLLH